MTEYWRRAKKYFLNPQKLELLTGQWGWEAGDCYFLKVGGTKKRKEHEY